MSQVPTIPAQQKVLFVMTKQGALEVQDADIAQLDPGEVLIKVEAAIVNPVDWKIYKAGLWFPDSAYPMVIGFEGAGTVTAVGSDVSHLEVGDRVAMSGHLKNKTSLFQQYASIRADMVPRIPSSISFDGAAAMIGSFWNVAISLYNPHEKATGLRLTPPWTAEGRGKFSGRAALVMGGTCTWDGLAPLQCLRASGFSPIVVAADTDSFTLVLEAGATHVVDRSLPPDALLEEVTKIAGKRADVVFDAISRPETQNAAYHLTASGGSVLLVCPNAIEEAQRVKREGEGEAINVVDVHALPTLPANVGFGPELVRGFETLVAEESLSPVPIEVLPDGLRGVAAGITRLEAKPEGGTKLVIHPHETV
ncbi:GroES-like protein [Epithele typhae]|uniref:GroES-like protein n=1 Tax=Epithele typhae TaxID=378194 RepID=UPI0020084402|nr:GroES-like protein [Epithele typhae]KAH9913693.1 GroES-like protein [Epithele typhae]